MRTVKSWTILVACLWFAGGCANQQPELIASKKGAVELRAMQSRMFETDNRGKVFRAVIATFQDLGFSITNLEPEAGTVSADKLSQLEMTATVYPRGESRTIVRSNAIVKLAPGAKTGHQVDSAEFYQQRFFEPLSKALFLTALQVEDEGESDGSDSGPAVEESPQPQSNPAPNEDENR